MSAHHHLYSPGILRLFLKYPRLTFQTRSSMEIAVSVSDDSEVACFSFNRKNLLDFDFQVDCDTLRSGRRDES